MVNGTLEPDRAAKRATGDAAHGHRAVRVVAWIAFAVLVPAALLTAIGPSLAAGLMRTHPERAEIAPDAPDPRATIARLESLDPGDGDTVDAQALAGAARLISGAIVDHWPRGDEIDPAVATMLLEHPPRWAAIQLVRALPASWESRVPNHAERMRIERRDWRGAVMLGVGTDGQRALALARYLREKGVDAWPVVAEGRAVCVLGEPEATRALDPASGLVIGISARTDYGEPTTLLSRRGRVLWTLALGVLGLLAWRLATGRSSLSSWRDSIRRGCASGIARGVGRAPAPILRGAALAARASAGACALVVLASGTVAALVSIGPWLGDRFVAQHPLRVQASDCKPGLACIDPTEAIAQLEALDPRTEAGLREANRIFAAAILHHWPARGEEAPPTAVRLYEDLPLWWTMNDARKRGDLDTWARLAWLERGHWRSAIRMGVGFCSQHAIAISDYLREKGVEARPYGLDGHVVARVNTPSGEWILDPDYALVLPRSIEDAGADFEGTRDAYLAIGVGPSIASHVASTYGPEGNTEYEITFVGTDAARDSAWIAEARRLAWRFGLFAFGLLLVDALLRRAARLSGAERARAAAEPHRAPAAPPRPSR